MSDIYKGIFGTDSVEEFYGTALIDSLYEEDVSYDEAEDLIDHIEALNCSVDKNFKQVEEDRSLQEACWELYRGGIMLLSLVYNSALYAEGYEEFDSVPKLSQLLLNFFCEWGGSTKFLLDTFSCMQYLGIQLEKD